MKCATGEHQPVQGQEVVGFDAMEDAAHVGELVGSDGVFRRIHR